MASTKAERRAIQDAQRGKKKVARMDNPARVIFVRHGQTNWNSEGRMQGQLAEGEVPVLTDLGISQAHAVAAHIAEAFKNVSCIYTSDLKRAMQTAEIIRSQMPTVKLEAAAAARERHVGVLQGLMYPEAAQQHPAAFAVLRGGAADEAIPGGGESEDAFFARAQAFLQHLAAAERGSTVVVVSHGGFLGMVHRACTGHAYGRLFQNCAFGEVLLEGGAAALLQWDVAVSDDVRGSVAGGGRFG